MSDYNPEKAKDIISDMKEIIGTVEYDTEKADLIYETQDGWGLWRVYRGQNGNWFIVIIRQDRETCFKKEQVPYSKLFSRKIYYKTVTTREEDKVTISKTLHPLDAPAVLEYLKKQGQISTIKRYFNITEA
jgi:hypothetical protein